MATCTFRSLGFTTKCISGRQAGGLTMLLGDGKEGSGRGRGFPLYSVLSRTWRIPGCMPRESEYIPPGVKEGGGGRRTLEGCLVLSCPSPSLSSSPPRGSGADGQAWCSCRLSRPLRHALDHGRPSTQTTHWAEHASFSISHFFHFSVMWAGRQADTGRTPTTVTWATGRHSISLLEVTEWKSVT